MSAEIEIEKLQNQITEIDNEITETKKEITETKNERRDVDNKLKTIYNYDLEQQRINIDLITEYDVRIAEYSSRIIEFNKQIDKKEKNRTELNSKIEEIKAKGVTLSQLLMTELSKPSYSEQMTESSTFSDKEPGRKRKPNENQKEDEKDKSNPKSSKKKSSSESSDETKDKTSHMDQNVYTEESNLKFNLINITTDDIYDGIRERQVLGGGACGTVNKIFYNNQYYAVKCCDVYKTTDYHLNELKNEAEILKYLNSKQIEFVPTIYFKGIAGIFDCIVTSLIEGKFIEYDQMSLVQKETAINNVQKLHDIFCLHRDIREQNFICRGNEVFIIDFGRSEILPETNESKELLRIEMKQLLWDLNYKS